MTLLGKSLAGVDLLMYMMLATPRYVGLVFEFHTVMFLEICMCYPCMHSQISEPNKI